MIATSGLGCGAAADEEVDLSPVTACASVTAGGPWGNQPFEPQSGPFSVVLTATPSANAIDAVVGLGDGSATSFAALAAAVRFNPEGTIDVRSGSTYRVDIGRRYQAGLPYQVRFDVDLATHTYTVWVQAPGDVLTPIAQGYPFRLEQASVSRLGVVASKVDSPAGSLEVCGVQLIAGRTAPPGCLVARAHDGFATTAVADATVISTVAFTVYPSAPDLDAVIGLSAARPTRFADLATAVRFATPQVIEVRDGDVYRSDGQRYGTSSFNIELVSDLTSHRYSAFNYEFKIATQARFRVEQQAVTHLGQLSAIVDGPGGSVAVCQIQGQRSTNAAYSREGRYATVPLANNEAVLSDGATIQRVSATGQRIAQVAGGGELAADPAGNVFAATIADTSLTVRAYAQDLAPRWTAVRTVPAGAAIVATTADAAGVVVAYRGSTGDEVTVVRLTANGQGASQRSFPAPGLLALDGEQVVTAVSDAAGPRVTRRSATGEVIWTRTFAGRADITALVVDPLHNVVFGGVLATETDFGGGPLPLLWNGEQDLNGYVVKLSPAGAHVFSRNAFMMQVNDVASNGTRVVVAGIELANWFRPRVMYFDDAGTRTPWSGDPIFHSDLGRADEVEIGPSGRVWLGYETRQGPGLRPQWPYLVVLTD